MVWAVLYYIFNFIIKEKKIREQNYQNLFFVFKTRFKWSAKILKNAGPKWAPLVFQCYHFGFFAVSHIISLMAYYSKWAHTGFMFFWLFIMTWNGANFYVKYFKYTQKLTTQQLI